MSIYDNTITPTYLYIKQHSVTGLKYFGKTTRKDPVKYIGSGTFWNRHIKKHGKEFVKTIWLSDLYYDTSIVEIALLFSNENNIVESKEWANLILENGLDGTEKGSTHTLETKAKMSVAWQNRGPVSEETRAKLSVVHSGRIVSANARSNMSAAQKGRIFSDEHKANLAAAQQRRPPVTDETRAKLSAAGLGKHRQQHTTESKIKMSKSAKNRAPASAETKAIMSAAQQNRAPVSDEIKKILSEKAKNRVKHECPYCKNSYSGSHYTRWHGNNCKQKN